MTSVSELQDPAQQEDILGKILAGQPPQTDGRIDLRGAHLAGSDLSGQNLTNADLTGADLNGANLAGAILMGADLTNARLFAANLAGAMLSEAILHNAELSGSDLTGAHLERVTATRAGFGKACLKNARLDRACLDDATLSSADLTGAHLTNASLRNARLREAVLDGADLNSADLEYAHLSLARVNGASFRNAGLRGARMRMVQEFESADWAGVDLREVSFPGSLRLRRFIMDQNYIMEFRQSSRTAGLLYYPWMITSDCGRSLARWCTMIMIITVIFALIYKGVGIDFGDHETWLSPYYFSVVTITTLGFGDVVPTTVAGQVVTMAEVILGYVMLGGLLAIFSNKIARRAE